MTCPQVILPHASVRQPWLQLALPPGAGRLSNGGATRWRWRVEYLSTSGHCVQGGG